MRARIRWLTILAAAALLPCLADRPARAERPAGPSGTVQGMAYGPFREGQSPEWGIYPTLDDVRDDMPLLALVGNGVRSYGCQDLETIVTASEEVGLPLALGAWLSGVADADRAEIECAVAQALASPNVATVVVGSESVLRGNLSPSEVCAYLEEVRGRTGRPVTTAEPWHVWVSNPDLAACADFLLVHIHPYWECQPIDGAVDYVQEKHGAVAAQFPGRRVVIGETGWPSEGMGREGVCGPMPEPTAEEQRQFAEAFLAWARPAGVEYYFFDAFDEPWKCESGRPEVECHWGIFDTNRASKPARGAFVPYRVWVPGVMR